MTHYVKADPETDAHGYYRAWCGRYVRPNQTTLALKKAQCSKCHDAFARMLRSLPDVFPKPHHQETPE